MTTTRFSYAVQIQPQTGQELLEFPQGCELDSARLLTAKERRANPNAARQAWEGSVLVITAAREIYLVPEDEAN